jgi:uncharacterized protein YdaU (DUF1376 family)
MGNLKWFKFDPNAALTGTLSLTLEERGAYYTVLCLIYDSEGSVADDEQILAWLRCNARVWKRIREKLLKTGKLYIHGGRLRNRRADDEVNLALQKIASSAKAGLASAASRRQAIEILKGSVNARSTDVQPPTPTPTKLSFLSAVANQERGFRKKD